MKNNIFYLIIILFITTSCYKKPNYSIVPEIQLVALNLVNNPILSSDDSYIRISFTDGDGDLGRLNNNDTINVKNLIIKNLKFSNSPDSTLNLPVIPQKGTTNAISGYIDVYIKSQLSGCLNLYPIDTANFTIQIKDRAGHLSNKLNIAPVLYKCQ